MAGAVRGWRGWRPASSATEICERYTPGYSTHLHRPSLVIGDRHSTAKGMQTLKGAVGTEAGQSLHGTSHSGRERSLWNWAAACAGLVWIRSLPECSRSPGKKIQSVGKIRI